MKRPLPWRSAWRGVVQVLRTAFVRFRLYALGRAALTVWSIVARPVWRARPSSVSSAVRASVSREIRSSEIENGGCWSGTNRGLASGCWVEWGLGCPFGLCAETYTWRCPLLAILERIGPGGIPHFSLSSRKYSCCRPSSIYSVARPDESRRSLHQECVYSLQCRSTRIDVLFRSNDPAEPLADELFVDCGTLLQTGVVA